jgi:acetylornithine deacetylase/succinyl-diaminopimelate desuccinylase-like protein
MAVPQPIEEGAGPRLYEDLREWLEIVDSLGELKKLEGAHWKLEIEVGEYILGWLKDHGLETVRQVVAENRINAIGIVPGRGEGPSRIFNGHTDPVYVGSEEDAPVLGHGVLKRESLPRAYVKDNRLYGEGVYNDKGNVAAFLIAGQAIKASGVTLRGGVLLTAVVGEIERAPIGAYQGALYEGGGHGTRYMLGHGITSDYPESEHWGNRWRPSV